MEIKKIKLYTFEELSEEAKERALEEAPDLTDWDWYWGIEEDFKEKMYKMYGCSVDNIYFSGFYSQGDGAGFSGDIYMGDYLKKTRRKHLYPNLSKYLKYYNTHIKIGSGREENEYSMTFEDEGCFTDSEKQGEEYDELLEEIVETCREEARNLYRELEEEYDYLTSEENIRDYYMANEVLFYEDGRLPNF